EITTFCGSDAVLPATMSGQYGYVYSGECHMLPDYDKEFFEELVRNSSSVQEVKDKVEALNSIGVTVDDCGVDYTDRDSLIRDAYLCEDGEWSEDAFFHHRGWHSHRAINFPDVFSSSSSSIEDNCPVSPDPDCPYCDCKEFFQVKELDCEHDMEGVRVRIEKHECPQYGGAESYKLYAYDFCECEPGPITESQNCHDYYRERNWYRDMSGGSTWRYATGRVSRIFQGICENGRLVKSGDPIGADTSECVCRNYNDIIDYNDCPAGLTNSWSFQGQIFKNVESVEYKRYTCPEGYNEDEFGNKLPLAGYYEDETTFGPVECACDDTLTKEFTRDCEDEDLGGKVVYEAKWDCDLNDWEPENKWKKISDTCRPCSWQPQGNNISEPVNYGEIRPGDPCSCSNTERKECIAEYLGSSGLKKLFAAGCKCTLQGG
ncbi:MAG: hypothetical protein ACLFP8_02575, partial [Alphaproteobacteria bacterium]